MKCFVSFCCDLQLLIITEFLILKAFHTTPCINIKSLKDSMIRFLACYQRLHYIVY